MGSNNFANLSRWKIEKLNDWHNSPIKIHHRIKNSLINSVNITGDISKSKTGALKMHRTSPKVNDPSVNGRS